MVKLVNDIFVSVQTSFPLTTTRCCRGQKKGSASRVRLAVPARQKLAPLQEAKTNRQQRSTFFTGTQSKRLSFQSSCRCHLPLQLHCQRSKQRQLSHAAALPWWTETRPLPQLFSSGKRRCEWNLVPSHQLTGYWAIPVSKT